MKVLFSGAWNPSFEALPEYLVAALEKAGHEVTTFDHRGYRIPGRLRTRLPAFERWDRRGINQRLLRLARETRPDLLLVNQGSVLTAATVSAVRRETGAAAVNWWSDYPGEFAEGLSLARSDAYDLFLVSGTDARNRHHESGVTGTRWLPFACDPFHHRPVQLSAPELDRFRCNVVFVGSAYPERREVLAGLADLGLGIWGPGWERYASDPVIGPCIRGAALRPAEWVRAYSAAEVVLNVSYAFGEAPQRYGTLANVRVFEALACGTCQVVDAKRDITDLFRDGEHLVVFRTAGEARQVIESLLADPGRRRYIGTAGRTEVQVRHTWSHRVEALLGRLAEKKTRRCGGCR